MDKIFLIGHRGVGKSTMIADLQAQSKKYICFDLDYELEVRRQVTIKDLFAKGKVAEFRQMELDVLNEIIFDFENQKNKSLKTLVVALGAGLHLEKFKVPKSSMLLWLRRATDPNGRIFSDRPALTDKNNPLDEWNTIFSDREIKYKKFCTAQLYLPEFSNKNFNPLYEYLNFKSPKNGYVTLLPKENDQILQSLNCNTELRTDLISEKEIKQFLKSKTCGHYIVAIRDQNPKDFKLYKSLRLFKKIKVRVDWDLALGLPEAQWLPYIDIFSSHGADPVLDILVAEDFIQGSQVKKSKPLNIEYKICPEVKSHEEAIHLEYEIDDVLKGKAYSYLPRSTSSFNLSYHRQIKSYQQSIGFFKFGEGSSKDQPFWWQWPKVNPKGFYGIFGQNISHSYTPSFHFDFFQKKNLWPLFIESFDSFFKFYSYFQKNKIKALAVTSPYKTSAYEFALDLKSQNKNSAKTKLDSEALKYKAVNTFVFDKDLKAFNTDIIGLNSFLKQNLDLQKPMIVWGGGALLEQLKELCPKAIFFSAQTGKGRTDGDNRALDEILKTKNTSLPLIWASGEKGSTPATINEKIVITKVVDLDYRENSRAKLYSYLNSIHYVSGLDFFVKQGLAQQKIWDEYEF